MKPRNPHIVEALHLVAQGFGGKRRFLGSIHVAGASSSHHNSAIARWFRHVPKQPHARNVKVSEFIGEVVGHKAYRFGLHAGDEHRLCAALLQRFRNAANLIRGFSFAIDNLGGVLAQGTMMIHLGIPQVGKGLLLQGKQRFGWRGFTCGNAFQDLLYSIGFHAPLRSNRNIGTSIIFPLIHYSIATHCYSTAWYHRRHNVTNLAKWEYRDKCRIFTLEWQSTKPCLRH